MKIRIAVFDDNPKRREALSMLLSATENFECTGLFNDCRDVLVKIQGAKPDVVLMDIDMPYVNGIEGVAEIRKHFPHLYILMQTVFEDDDKIFAAICAGANGYILKQASAGKIVDGVKEVVQGGAPMTPTVAAKVLRLFKSQGKANSHDNFELTKRELEILGLLVKGFSYKMIAAECHISYATVNSHVSKIYSKLQVESSAGAVAKAIRQGLVS